MEAPNPTAAAKSDASDEPVVVSGIQPSGRLHLGNYFGAIRQHIDLHEQHEAYYFIVNYHAMTTVDDPERLREHTFDVALDYLALGFDPEEAALFVQSDVPEVTELTWIFMNLLPTSRLEKGVAYKDKVDAGLTPNAGLFNYPVLQAADILIYGGSLVPVGADQKQNIEITRDLARRFNNTYCPEDEPLFPIPDPHILDDVAVVPGIDGQKMSKSYGNTIGIFDEGDELKDKVMSIVTDSKPNRRTRKAATFSPSSSWLPRRKSRNKSPSSTATAATATATPSRTSWRSSRTTLLRRGPSEKNWSNGPTTFATSSATAPNRPANGWSRSWSAFGTLPVLFALDDACGVCMFVRMYVCKSCSPI